MKRKLLFRALVLAALMAAASVIAVAVFWGLLIYRSGPSPSIKQDTFSSIKYGMSEQEVEMILGAPPGHYDRRKPFGVIEYPWSTGVQYKLWYGDEGLIVIGLNDRDEVVEKVFVSNDSSN